MGVKNVTNGPTDKAFLGVGYEIKSTYNEKGKDWKRARSTLAPTFTAVKMKKMSGIMSGTVG